MRSQRSGAEPGGAAAEDTTADRSAGGIVSACTSCSAIHTSGAEWLPIAEYLRTRFGLAVQDGVCPDCLERCYPDLAPHPDGDREGCGGTAHRGDTEHTRR